MDLELLLLSSFFMAQGKETIQFRLNSSVNVPFYVATTQNTTGSDLASGVTNNGATCIQLQEEHTATERDLLLLR